jgi:hypothetical protein
MDEPHDRPMLLSFLLQLEVLLGFRWVITTPRFQLSAVTYRQQAAAVSCVQTDF